MTYATASWKNAVPPIQSQLFDSLRMVASAAAQGMYSKQKTIRHTALRGPNPIPASAAAKEVMPEEELNYTSDNIGTYVDDMGSYSLPEYDTSGGGASYNDTTYSDQYNVTVNVTSPGATAEEIAAAVGREIATLAQSRR